MVFDIFFRIGPAIKALFGLGYEPKKEMFHELTSEQYELLEQRGEDISVKIFTLLADDPKYEVPELLIFTKDDIQDLLDAVDFINDFCLKEAKKDADAPIFNTFQDKLKYAAAIMPHTFTKDTAYERYSRFGNRPKLKVIK